MYQFLESAIAKYQRSGSLNTDIYVAIFPGVRGFHLRFSALSSMRPSPQQVDTLRAVCLPTDPALHLYMFLFSLQ